MQAAAQRGEPYDIVTLDMRMPGMSGMDLALWMTADPVLKPVRRVLLTAMRVYPGKEELGARRTQPGDPEADLGVGAARCPAEAAGAAGGIPFRDGPSRADLPAVTANGWRAAMCWWPRITP